MATTRNATRDAPGTLAGLAPSAPVRVEPPRVVLRTERLKLRPLEPADRDAYVGTIRASRAELDRWSALHQEGETDESLFERQLWLTREGERTGRALRRIGVLADGTIAGGFNLNAISRGLEARADVNVWVATPLAGRGLATEGLAAIVEHATADLPEGLGLHLIEAGIRRGNVASRRVVERLGFVCRGNERTHLRTGEDWVLHDIYAYSVGPAV